MSYVFRWLVVTVVLAAVFETASAAGLLADLFLAQVLLALAARLQPEPLRLSRAAELAFLTLVVATPVRVMWNRMPSVFAHESLHGVGTYMSDRLALQAPLALHPQVVQTDRPQTFFLLGAEPGAEVTFDGVHQIETESLGAGLLRIDYDPEVHGRPAGSERAQMKVRSVDATEHTLGIRVVVPHAHPRWLRTSSDRNYACVTSEETDEILIVSARESRRIAAFDAPVDCAFVEWFGVPHVVVAHRFDDLAWCPITEGPMQPWSRLPLRGGAQALAALGADVAVALDSEDGRVVIAADAVITQETAFGLPIDHVVFGATPSVVVASSRHGARLVRWDRVTAQTSERRLQAPAVTLTRFGRGETIAFGTTDWAEVAAEHMGNHFVQDQIVWLASDGLGVHARLRTAHRTARQDAAGDVDSGLSPMTIHGQPDGSFWVAFAGSDEVAEFSPSGQLERTINVAPLGLSAPHSVVELADGTLVVSSPSSGRVSILEPDGRLRRHVPLALWDTDLLRTNPEALRRRFGERAFYEATRAGISCQSCHTHGQSDGVAHNIGGRRLAPTLDVRGMAGLSPFLRDGSYPLLADLHEVAEEVYRGYREPAPARGETIAAWLESLPPPRSRSLRRPAQERRGYQVFRRAGCAECHAPPAFTNLGRHVTRALFPDAVDAGTSLDTPSLRGVSARSRWLVDGRAHSLRQVLIESSDGMHHGRTRDLGETDIDDLIAFLESL